MMFVWFSHFTHKIIKEQKPKFKMQLETIMGKSFKHSRD